MVVGALYYYLNVNDFCFGILAPRLIPQFWSKQVDRINPSSGCMANFLIVCRLCTGAATQQDSYTCKILLSYWAIYGAFKIHQFGLCLWEMCIYENALLIKKTSIGNHFKFWTWAGSSMKALLNERPLNKLLLGNYDYASNIQYFNLQSVLKNPIFSLRLLNSSWATDWLYSLYRAQRACNPNGIPGDDKIMSSRLLSCLVTQPHMGSQTYQTIILF